MMTELPRSAAEFGLTHIPALERTQFGAPLLPDLFAKAQRLAANDLLSYVNADIILLPDFIEALNLARSVREKFLMVARVWRVRIDDRWNFQEPDCESKLRAFVKERGRQSPPPGNSDFFAFPRGLVVEDPRLWDWQGSLGSLAGLRSPAAGSRGG